MNKRSIPMFLAAAVVLIAAVPASAAKSSISLVTPNTSAATASTTPKYADQVTFSVTTTAGFPWVDTTCSQGGQVVYEQWAGFFDSYAGSKMFTLGPTQLWTGGAASCTATLVSFDRNGRPSKLASTNFTVAG